VTVRPFTYFLLSNVATYSRLGVGHTYRFTVLGIDDAGNLETTITPDNQWVWTVSNPVPNTVITSGPPRVTTRQSALIDFNEVPEDPQVAFVWTLTSSLPLDPEETGEVLATVPSRQPVSGLGSLDTAVQYVFSVSAWKDYDGKGEQEQGEVDPTPATYTWTVVPPASVDDPGVPRPEFPDDALPPGVSGNYGVAGYVDAPGEQPVKYMREEARRR
jgi:hypothetical protein